MCKESRALCSTFGNIAMKIVCTKVSIFLKPQHQRVEEEVGCYESTVEDEGLIYSHSCRNCSLQSRESTSFFPGTGMHPESLSFVEIWRFSPFLSHRVVLSVILSFQTLSVNKGFFMQCP